LECRQLRRSTMQDDWFICHLVTPKPQSLQVCLKNFIASQFRYTAIKDNAIPMGIKMLQMSDTRWHALQRRTIPMSTLSNLTYNTSPSERSQLTCDSFWATIWRQITETKLRGTTTMTAAQALNPTSMYCRQESLCFGPT
jgi:hypothetical protein